MENHAPAAIIGNKCCEDQMTKNAAALPFFDCLAHGDGVIFIASDGSLAGVPEYKKSQGDGPDRPDTQPQCPFVAISQAGKTLYRQNAEDHLTADIFLVGGRRLFALAGCRQDRSIARILIQGIQPPLLAHAINMVIFDAASGSVLYLAGFDSKEAAILSQEQIRQAGSAETPVKEIRTDPDFRRLAAALAPFDFSGLLLEAPAGLWLRNPVEAAIRALESSGKCHTRDYLATYPDVADSGLSPIRHFIMHGIEEGRKMPLKTSALWQ